MSLLDQIAELASLVRVEAYIIRGSIYYKADNAASDFGERVCIYSPSTKQAFLFKVWTKCKDDEAYEHNPRVIADATKIVVCEDDKNKQLARLDGMIPGTTKIETTTIRKSLLDRIDAMMERKVPDQEFYGLIKDYLS